jgi:cytochrome c oxidase assembly protein subunit 15
LSSHRAHAIAARLGLLTSLCVFGLIVLGSIVRTTGSGLACPDWPLCHGRLIPPLQFNVLIEWGHRAVALAVSLLVFATAIWVIAHRELRARLGGLVGLMIGLLAAQVLLGALTVWKLLHPSVVSSHLAVALLLFATLLAITLVAESHSEPAPSKSGEPAPRPGSLLPVFLLATTLTYAQAVLGGAVSSSHAALACPDWPTCNGEWFPSLHGLAGLHMLHRYGAYLVTVVVAFAAFQARRTPDAGVRAGAWLALGLNLLQVVLGISNVYLGAPTWLSAIHLATATAMLAMLVTVTYRVAALPAPARRLAAVTP